MWQAIKNENPGINETGKIKVYRATVGDEIRPNDYVAANKQISIDHLENLKDRGEGGARIIEMEVSPDELMMANDATEFVFTPKESPLAGNAESSILGGNGKAADLKAKILKANPGIELGLSGRGDVITIDKIIAKGKGTGAGTKAMRDIIAHADQTGKTLALTPSADFGGSVPRLKKLYKSLGFVENKGKNKNFEISETMVKAPISATSPR